MVNLILAIKPEYISQIMSHKKSFEYRRFTFKQSPLQKAYLYSSGKIKKIVGEFTIEEVIEGKPEELFQKVQPIKESKEAFLSYFKDLQKKGTALRIKDPYLYDQPKKLEEIDPVHKRPPRSFYYVD